MTGAQVAKALAARATPPLARFLVRQRRAVVAIVERPLFEVYQHDGGPV